MERYDFSQGIQLQMQCYSYSRGLQVSPRVQALQALELFHTFKAYICVYTVEIRIKEPAFLGDSLLKASFCCILQSIYQG